MIPEITYNDYDAIDDYDEQPTYSVRWDGYTNALYMFYIDEKYNPFNETGVATVIRGEAWLT